MEKVNWEEIRQRKADSRNPHHQKISMLTAYDYSMARILDESGLDIILVGDSLGNVIMGEPDTRKVTMEIMVYHTKAVAKGVKHALLVSDLPVGAMKDPIKNARSLVQAGADAVKVEGIEDLEGIKAIRAAGIPVMGHLGLLPQTAREYRVQRFPEIIAQAKELEKADVFAVVLEMVEENLAEKVTHAVKIPTIGCGSGNKCNGKVVVSYDLLGLYPNAPKFVRRKIDLAIQIKMAVSAYISE